jgi:flagellar basal body-associated protein FliL
MEPQNSNKTMWVLVSAGAIIIVAIAIYYAMLGNKGVEVLEQDKTPETVSSEVQEGLNSTDLGNLDADINSLDADINKL